MGETVIDALLMELERQDAGFTAVAHHAIILIELCKQLIRIDRRFRLRFVRAGWCQLRRSVARRRLLRPASRLLPRGIRGPLQCSLIVGSSARRGSGGSERLTPALGKAVGVVEIQSARIFETVYPYELHTVAYPRS